MLKKYDYDFKDEIQEYRECKNDDLYKFLMYKSGMYAEKFDCDRCELAKKLYSTLWNFNLGDKESFKNMQIGKNNILMGMDTMNSFWTTFAWALNKWCKQDVSTIFGINYVTSDSAKTLLGNYSELKKIIINNLSKEIFDKFVVFARLTHTIGNLVLVPKKVEPYTKEKQTFNMARASKWNDYFDLSLIWLKENEDSNWDSETFKNYRKMFFLEEYISENGEIIPLINEHTKIIKEKANIDSRPQTKDELLELLNNTIKRIEVRGNVIFKKLLGNDGKPVYVEKEKTIEGHNENRGTKIFFVKRVIYNVVSMLLLFFIPAIFGTLLILEELIYDTNMSELYFASIWIGVSIIELVIMFVISLWLAKKSKDKYIKSQGVLKENDIQIKYISYSGIIIGAFGVLIFASIWIATWNWEENILEGVVMGYFFVLVIWIMVLVVRYKNRCRKCKLMNVLKRSKKKLDHTEDIVIKEKEMIWSEEINDEGQVVRGYGKYEDVLVPGVRNWYKLSYTCRCCGQKYYSIHSIDKKKSR